MLHDTVDPAVVVDLDLAGGLIVELVSETEASLKCLGLPVEGEFGANDLRVKSSMVHKEEELSKFNSLAVGGLVLEANESTCSGRPVDAPVVLLKVLFLGIEDDVGTEGEVALKEVAESELTDKGSHVEEKLSLCLIVGEVEAKLPVVGVSNGGGRGVDEELEAGHVGGLL